jgi:hypothetical protein
MKKIDKHTLRNIINETLGDMLLEGVRDQMSFGIKGPIPVEPASSLCDDVNPDVLAMVDSGDRSIPRRMIGDTKYFGGTKVWDAYEKYSAAITRRADLGRTAVNFFVFLNKIRKGWKGAPLQVYESNENYLIGTVRGGVFLCIYLCPKNVGVGMFKFIKEVCEFDNVVFAVTDDMADMLERLGCPKYDGTVQAKFRGQMHDKMVYGSTQEAAEQGAKLLGLMGKSGDLGNVIKDALQQNPKLQALYDQDPDIIFKLMNEPIITQCLMNNPKLVDTMINNPSIMQQMAVDPTKGFLAFLQQYKKSLSPSLNESKNRKK